MGPGQIEMEALGQELAQVRFTKLYRDHGRAVLEYVLRRVEAREDAADVVAETFLVVWRRMGEVPIGDEARRLGLPLTPEKMQRQRERGAPPPPN